MLQERPAQPSLPGTAAALVPSPPVYAPGGPMLLWHDADDADAALPAAWRSSRA